MTSSSIDTKTEEHLKEQVTLSFLVSQLAKLKGEYGYHQALSNTCNTSLMKITGHEFSRKRRLLQKDGNNYLIEPWVSLGEVRTEL